ncbi:MAG: hypothetical protein AAF684_10960 [Pseudomonadota bacterium]
MVALEMASFGPSDFRAGDNDFDFKASTGTLRRSRAHVGVVDAPQASPQTQPVIAVVDEAGAPLAFVPTDMADGQARAHAAMIAAAPRLLDLARFAAAHVGEGSHPGVLRAFKAYCAEVVDKVEDQILVR